MGSRSSRARGLKHKRGNESGADRASRSSRARGLKRVFLWPRRRQSTVALFTGAWIETADDITVTLV